MRTRILQKVLKAIFIGMLILFVCLGIKEYSPLLKKLDIKNLASIITGAITLIVGLGAVLVTQSKIKKRELAEAHREKKIELYTRFNDKIFELFAGAHEKVTGQEPSEQNLIDFMLSFKKDLMFRASPKVIKAVIEFEKSSEDSKKGLSTLRFVDDIYRAMRADIGQSNFGLGSLELIQIFLKDKSEIWKIK